MIFRYVVLIRRGIVTKFIYKLMVTSFRYTISRNDHSCVCFFFFFGGDGGESSIMGGYSCEIEKIFFGKICGVSRHCFFFPFVVVVSM